ncbi:MAG: lectin-like protein [Oleispira sp.]
MIKIIKIVVLSLMFVANAYAAVYENFGSGQPDNTWYLGDGGEHCVAMRSDGKWTDNSCFWQSKRFACYDGVNWGITQDSQNLGSEPTGGKPHAQCQKLGSKFYFTAPFNAYENERLRQVILSTDSGEAWINVNDNNNEGDFESNTGFRFAEQPPYITRWFGTDTSSLDEPDGNDEDCGSMDYNGYWYDEPCDVDSSEAKRYLCVRHGENWFISDAQGGDGRLYAAEKACRSDLSTDATMADSTFGVPGSDNANEDIRNRIRDNSFGGLQPGERIWINFNDRLVEGDYNLDENRYFWNVGEPNGNVGGTEECVVRLGTNDNRGWNDTTCSATRSYACYRHSTDTWQAVSVSGSTEFNLAEGIKACQNYDNFSHQYTFWTPKDFNQNNSAEAINGSWLNVQWDSVTVEWLINRDASHWGSTVVNDKDGDGFNTNFRTISEPNDGVFPSHVVQTPSLNSVLNEDCASQQSNGSWYDLSCSTAMKFACYAADSNDWRLAPASANATIYTGENACQSLTKMHNYHFTAPGTRQQQTALALEANKVAVWVNATDRTDEKKWRYNQFLTFWSGEGVDADVNPEQPEKNELKDCAIAKGSDSALWYARSCTETHEYLCNNAGVWNLVSANTIDGSGQQSGQEACNSNGLFLAPDTILDQQTVAALITAKDVWINASDAQIEETWKVNELQFWDAAQPASPGDCAVMQKTAPALNDGLWISNECSAETHKYLCFDTEYGGWVESEISGTMEHFSNGQNKCEAMNGYINGEYHEFVFAAPIYTWENDAAKNAISENVWINGNDRITSNLWVFNEFLYWSGSALNPLTTDTNDCLTMNASGHWQDTACSVGSHKVACYSGDGWYLSPTNINVSNFTDAQRACNEIGNGYRFFSPVSVADNRDLRALLMLMGEGSVWINGIDIAEEGKWVFNSTGLPTPNWASTEPHGKTVENCAFVDASGLWYDAECSGVPTSDRKLVCKDGSGSLGISDNSIELISNFDAAHTECISKFGVGATFYAPITFNENEELRQILSSGDEVWVNASDNYIEARWALNIAPVVDYAAISPNTTLIDGCAYYDNQGSVVAASCSGEARAVVCSNGQEWKVTNNKVLLGTAANNGALIRNAFGMCQQEYSGDYTFAVPNNADTESKWELSQALALSGKTDAWLNMADWFVANKFSSNMPYQNVASNPVQANTGCAYSDGTGDGWLIASQCDAIAAHFACFNGSVWKIAPANGTIEEPAKPQNVIDAWDQGYGDLRCREYFGQSFNFSAPITPKEDASLKQVINRLDNVYKETWINYYSNRLWSGLNGQQWFADRINLNVVDGIELDQGATTEDCGSITKESGKLILKDEVCSTSKNALCFEGTTWSKTTSPSQWNKASAQCGLEFGEQHVFAIPRDSLERTQIDLLLSEGEVLWVNYSDLSVENKWRANIPVRQWWADSEPSNRGNRDCVVMGGVGSGMTPGEWRSDYCDQVFHQYTCKRGTAWKVVGLDGLSSSAGGIWAQGFSACRKIPDDSSGPWHFDFPEDYFANLATATTIAAFDNSDTVLTAELVNTTAWLNLTDQYREKDWQRGRQFSDWAADFAFDDNKDCAFVDTESEEVNGQSVQGTWQPGLCFASDTPRKYACTNGLNWTVTTVEGNNWLGGFDACAALQPAGDWTFAAPVTSFDNERLKAAIGSGSAWINLQDVSTDGDWAANLSKPNLPPIIKFSATDVSGKINQASVAEQSVGNNINFEVIDPEGSAALNVVITEISGEATITSSSSETVACNLSCNFSFIYNAATAANTIKSLSFKLVATDDAGLKTTTYFNSDVIPAIIAWYDFNDANKPNFDKTGNGNDANDNPELPYDFPPVINGAIDISSGSEKMTVNGAKLSMPKDYAVALRIWADADDEADYQSFQIKYDGTNQCFDLPGTGSSAAQVGNNVAMYTCEDASDQFWYRDETTGLIHSVANTAVCLAYPDDTSIKLSYCSNVQHPWTINSDGSIESVLIPGSYLYAATSTNDTNVVLATTKRTWITDKSFGRGILQKGPVANQPLLTFGDKTSYLTYTVGDTSGTTVEPLKEEQWVNVVVNVIGTQLTLFVDGIKETTVSLSAAAIKNDDDLIIGDIPSALRSFIGRVDDVQVFSRPLSDAEVVGILPEPPVGLIQFESATIVRQEPQAEGASLATPVVVKRTDGSNGQLRAKYKTHEKTASEGDDYLGLDGSEIINELVWSPDDEALYLTPEYDLLPLLSSLPAVSIDSVELNRTQPIFVAIDLSIPVDPQGVLWEQGGSGQGAFIGFNEAHELVVRAGSGGALPNAETARLVKSTASVAADLVGKTGTIFVEIDPTSTKHSVSAWFKEGGLFGEATILSLGSNASTSAFPSNEWQGGDPGMLGNQNGSLVVGEYPASPPFDVTYNGVISMGRFYNQLAPLPIERKVENAKLAKVTLLNEVTFKREPTERFDLEIINTERLENGGSWVAFPEATTGYLSQTEVSLLDYTKNPQGILQFSSSTYECSEPSTDDNTGTATYATESRLYRDCSVEVQRLTGDQGTVSVEYGISVRGLSYVFVSSAVKANTDVLFSSADLKLTFAPGERTKSINFRVIAEIGSNNRYENNEAFTLTLFNPRNVVEGENPPWLGDPVEAVVVSKDYAVGVVDMESTQSFLSEPLQSELDSHVKTVNVRRSEGSDGVAKFEVSIPSTGQIAQRGTDYDLLDDEMNVVSGTVALTWDDGQQSSLPVFIRIYSDKYQEVIPFIKTGDENADDNCYDGSDSDSLPDNLDRDCSTGESFELSLTELSDSEVPIHATRISTQVYIQDNTAPAVINFTTDTLALTTVSEVVTTNTVDTNNNGTFEEGTDIVADPRISLKIERSNRFSEHAVWLYIRGVTKAPAIAAQFVGINSSKAVADRIVLDRDQHDAWIQTPYVRDGALANEYKHLWVMPIVVESSIPNNSDLTVTTTVDQWHQGTTASNIAAITDGTLNLPYQVHPVAAQGKNINFSWTNDYLGGNVIFHNRNDGCCKTRIAGSRMSFYLDGNATPVHEFDFTTANSNVDTITIPIPDNVKFDQMRLVFSSTGDGNQNFREIEVSSILSEGQSEIHSMDVVIYDNERTNTLNRNLEFRIEEASIRDARVIDLGSAGSNSAAEFSDIEITDANLPPVFVDNDTSGHSYSFPQLVGNSMELKYNLEFSVSGYSIRAQDRDWINVAYSTNDGVQAPQSSSGKYPSWTFGDFRTTRASLPFTRNFTFTATDSEGKAVITSANISLNEPWRKIRANGNSCMIYSSNSGEDWPDWDTDCGAGDKFYWKAIPQGTSPETYQLLNKASGLCIHDQSVQGPVVNNDKWPIMRACASTNAQRWSFSAGDQSIYRPVGSNDRRYMCIISGKWIDLRNGNCSWDDWKWF